MKAPGPGYWKAALRSAAILSAIWLVPSRAGAGGLVTTYDQRGLVTLAYNGVTLVDVNARPGDAFFVADYNLGGTAEYGTTGYTASWDGSSLTWSWNWGSVNCRYSTPQGQDWLVVTVTVTNSSTQTLNGIDIYPFGIRFPALPRGFGAANYPQFHNNLDGPSLISADYGSGMVVLANADAQPLFLGLTPSGAAYHYGLLMGTIGNSSEGFLASATPVTRPVPPLQSATYSFSLRFAPSGTDYHSIAGDVLTTFAQAWPRTLQWSDRRPIGELFMTKPTSSPIPGSSPNPRNYTVASNIDIRTPQGLAAFQQAVLAYADNAIAILQKMNAQGFIVWDLEGQEYPQPNASYVGDPSLLPVMSPEMDGVANAFFQKFSDAGLRCGMTLRPQQLDFTVSPPNQDSVPTQNEAAVLIQRAQYAHNRWGCTLFYVDSDGGPYDATAPSTFQQVLQALPNILVIPENIWAKDYAYTAPLASFTATYKLLHTPADPQAMWPGAFTVTYVGDAPNGDLANNPNDRNQFSEFVQAVKRGDILSFRAWFDNEPLNGQVQQIYQMAGVLSYPPPSVTITSPSVGATVSGAVTISAGASGGIGAASVQFKLDGINISPQIKAAPYSIPWNTTTAANGLHTLTAMVQDMTGATALSAAVTVTVDNAASGTGGLLSGSGTSSAAAVNLTAEGGLDWVHWGDGSLNRKAGVTAQIGSDNVIGTGTVLTYNNGPRPMSWTDGTATPASSNNMNGIYIVGAGQGFSFTAPADTTARTLAAHVGGWNSGGTLTAHLSDGSAPDFVDVTTAATGQYDRNYTLSYQAGSAGQTLTVSWVMSSGLSYGNVTLNAAALTGAIISATAGTQSTAAGTAFPTALQVTVIDGGGNPVSGAVVTFTAPGGDPTANFAGSTSATATTSSSGVAAAPPLTMTGTIPSLTAPHRRGKP